MNKLAVMDTRETEFSGLRGNPNNGTAGKPFVLARVLGKGAFQVLSYYTERHSAVRGMNRVAGKRGG